MPEFAKIIPFILGAAISPVLLVTTLYLLSLKEKPVKKTLLYLASATVTIAVISVLIFSTTSINPTPRSNNDLILHILIGFILILLAISIYRKGPSRANSGSVKKQGNLRFVLLGVILMLTNFTTIAMIFEVAIELRANQIFGTAKSVYLALTIFSSLIPIILPLFILLVSGRYADAILKSLSVFMSKYSHIATSLFFMILGVFTIVKPFL